MTIKGIWGRKRDWNSVTGQENSGCPLLVLLIQIYDGN